MTRFASRVDICQAAAYKVGTETISNIETPRSVTESRLSFLYEKTKRAVLREGIWNFATKIVTITSSQEDLPEGMTKVFAFPNDFIRFMGLMNDGRFVVPETESYSISDGKIYFTNYTSDTLTLKYIRDVKDVGKFDDGFSAALVLRLAYELAYVETQKASLTNRLLQEYQLALGQAKMIDGQEQKPRVVCRSKWATARNSRSWTGVSLPWRT